LEVSESIGAGALEAAGSADAATVGGFWQLKLRLKRHINSVHEVKKRILAPNHVFCEAGRPLLSFLQSSRYQLLENDSQMQQENSFQTAIRMSYLPTGAMAALSFVDDETNCHVLRLCELGFVPGAYIQVLRKGTKGSPFLLRCNEIDLCLDAELAEKFWVEQTQEGS
jgi:Fe2+ transport system protein FeoA